MRHRAGPRDVLALRVIVYAGCVGGIATLFGALLVAGFGPPQVWGVVLFWALYCIADWRPLEVTVVSGRPGSRQGSAPTLSAGFLVLMTAAFAMDPPTAAAIGLFSGLVPWAWRGVTRTAFNSAQGLIYTGAAAVVFALVAGSVGGGPAAMVLAAVCAAVAAVVLNTALVGGFLALERGSSLREMLRALLWPIPHSLAFAVGALLLSALYGLYGPAAVAFLLVPLAVLRQARRGKLELDEAHERTLRAFVSAVELKDDYLWRHSERVAQIASEILRRLGGRPQELERIYYAALLHDIGKIAIPARVLNKPGSLTDREFELLRRHVDLGAETAHEVDMLRPLVPAIRHHHERIDGEGYPGRLEGAEIPRFARIIAVADTFEALTSARPYRGALPVEDARRELLRVSGRQLDAGAVDALVALLDEGWEFPRRFGSPPRAASPRDAADGMGGAR